MYNFVYYFLYSVRCKYMYATLKTESWSICLLVDVKPRTTFDRSTSSEQLLWVISLNKRCWNQKSNVEGELTGKCNGKLQ